MSFILCLLALSFLPVSEVSATMADTSAPYQTAFLYFLPDYEPKEEVSKAEIRGCRKIGYTFTRSNCAKPRILKGKCPVGNLYKECYCKGSPTCTGSTSSAMPYSSSKGAAMTSCVDCLGNTLYTWTCSRTCGADISSKPSNSSYTTCTDCSGTHNVGWSCNYGYHKSGNSCEEDCGPSSYNWCPVHYSCHTNCCTDGTIEPCDTRCGGSGCAPACTPMSSESGCSYGTYSCSDGCGGTRRCCSSAPATLADPCAGVTCSGGKICSNGSCVCPSGQCCPACTGGKTCSNGACVTADPCAGVTCPSGQSCSNGSCISTCVSGGSSSCSGQTSACSSSQVQTSSCKDCGGVTHYSCRAKTCAEQGKKDCNGSCISSSSCCTDSDCGSGKKCQSGSCVSTCVTGGSSSCSGQTSACSSSQVQTSSCKDCSGTTHYTCRAKTCSEQGKKDCNGSCIATTACCGGCPSGKECQNGSCVAKTTCSVSGYYNGSSCDGYKGESCIGLRGQLATSPECQSTGNYTSGACDTQSLYNCCKQCGGS